MLSLEITESSVMADVPRTLPVLRELAEHMADRVPVPKWIDVVLGKQWLGKKTGRGFYVYGEKKQKRVPRASRKLGPNLKWAPNLAVFAAAFCSLAPTLDKV